MWETEPTRSIPFLNKVAGSTPSMERQEWVEKALKSLRQHFDSHGYKVPDNIRVTIGWPKGGRTRVGECHYTTNSVDGHFEIFISPELGKGSKFINQYVMEVIAHEICHTIAGHKAGHKKPFKKVATAIGLEGKMTSTVPGPAMLALIKSFEETNGPYPAGALTRRWPTIDIDHKDTIKNNNKWNNLRETTESQNKANSNIPVNNTSGYKGVYWKKENQKWGAQIKSKNSQRHLGYFNTKEEAAEAYRLKAIELFGEFHRI